MIEALMRFVPAKWRVRGEVEARGEGQLALGETSLDYWKDRLGWSEDSARYLATAFTFGVRENVAAVLEKAQQLDELGNFEERFKSRIEKDPRIIGAALDASKFITCEELRDLLERILASDVGTAGTVSRRTVTIAENLGPEELAEFLKLRPPAWRVVDSDAEYKLVIGTAVSILELNFIRYSSSEIGVSYKNLRDLFEIGLTSYNPSGENLALSDDEEGIRMEYLDQAIFLMPSKKDQLLRTCQIDLTTPGIEIMKLFMSETYTSATGYFEEVCRFWESDGWGVEALES